MITLFGLRYEHRVRASMISFRPHAKAHSPVLTAMAAGKCRVGNHQKTFQHRARFIERLPFVVIPRVPVLTTLILGLEFPERVLSNYLKMSPRVVWNYTDRFELDSKRVSSSKDCLLNPLTDTLRR